MSDFHQLVVQREMTNALLAEIHRRRKAERLILLQDVRRWLRAVVAIKQQAKGDK